MLYDFAHGSQENGKVNQGLSSNGSRRRSVSPKCALVGCNIVIVWIQNVRPLYYH